MPPGLRVAAFQSAYTEDLDEAEAEVRRGLRWCDDHRVHIACFPECYLGGYFPNDRDRSSSVALDLSEPRFQDLVRATAGHRAAVIVGLTERRGAELRNTAVVIVGGALIGTYTKAHPNEAFFEPGLDYPVFSLFGARIGVNICNDANFPEAAAAVASQGAQVIFMPLNNRMRPSKAEAWRARHIANLQTRAAETGCWVVSADVVGSGGSLISYGCTAVVSPGAEVCARVAEGSVGRAVYEIPPKPNAD
jgi:predicted amidohydrolase